MPIRRDLRWFYPIDWHELSRMVRFGRAGGRCETCGRPHGKTVMCLPGGRWLDEDSGRWRDGRGRLRAWPAKLDMTRLRTTFVVTAAAHLDHDVSNSHPRNLRSLCQRCHILHDAPHHAGQRWITYRLRSALGDLFIGPYQGADLLDRMARARQRRPASEQTNQQANMPSCQLANLPTTTQRVMRWTPMPRATLTR